MAVNIAGNLDRRVSALFHDINRRTASLKMRSCKRLPKVMEPNQPKLRVFQKLLESFP
jgi:hypothetical protein